MSEINERIDKILFKLDQLINLIKISSRPSLDLFKKEVERDPTARKILDISKDPIPYSSLVQEVRQVSGQAEITIKIKIADLKDKGLLISSREGRRVFYQNSGLID